MCASPSFLVHLGVLLCMHAIEKGCPVLVILIIGEMGEPQARNTKLITCTLDNDWKSPKMTQRSRQCLDYRCWRECDDGGTTLQWQADAALLLPTEETSQRDAHKSLCNTAPAVESVHATHGIRLSPYTQVSVFFVLLEASTPAGLSAPKVAGTQECVVPAALSGESPAPLPNSFFQTCGTIVASMAQQLDHRVPHNFNCNLQPALARCTPVPHSFTIHVVHTNQILNVLTYKFFARLRNK